MVKKWQKTVYEKELKSFKEREQSERRMRELARTKRKAKVVGTLKYGKTTALIKGGRAVGRGIKKASVEAKKRREVRSSMPQSKKKGGYFSGDEWKKRLRKNYSWK